MSGQWVDLPTAAELLGTTTEAVRKRASRGSLRSDRQDGRVVVWVDDGRTEGGREAQVDREALLEAKEETIRILQEQLRLRAEEIQRRDVIISQLTQANAALTARVPELEAPSTAEPTSGTREDAVTAAPEPGRVEEPQVPLEGATPEEPAQKRRSWWRRMFGG
jgi:hypothetical protein